MNSRVSPYAGLAGFAERIGLQDTAWSSTKNTPHLSIEYEK